MCDEYQQSLERQKLLEEKLTELKKSRGELTTGKKDGDWCVCLFVMRWHLVCFPGVNVDEMYASLQRTNAEMYIARSQVWAVHNV